MSIIKTIIYLDLGGIGLFLYVKNNNSKINIIDIFKYKLNFTYIIILIIRIYTFY